MLAPTTVGGILANFAADTAFGFALNLPGFILNYGLSGCGWGLSFFLGFKASAAVCWTSSISGMLFDTFRALDSDEPAKVARAPVLIRWLVINRFELRTRKKLIWLCLAGSILATAAVYAYAPGGLLR